MLPTTARDTPNHVRVGHDQGVVPRWLRERMSVGCGSGAGGGWRAVDNGRDWRGSGRELDEKKVGLAKTLIRASCLMEVESPDPPGSVKTDEAKHFGVRHFSIRPV